MKFSVILFLYLTLISSWSEAPESNSILIVWNVGQGQWVTERRGSLCRHFDFGGEIQHFSRIENKVTQLCGNKINELYLSHADRDHYGYLNPITRRLKNLCWRVRPENSDLNESIRIPNCAQGRSERSVQFISSRPPIFSNRSVKTDQIIRITGDCGSKKRNRCSSIFKVGKTLLPGDSPTSIEQIWKTQLRNRKSITKLLLGHHGSATSTSEALLDQLPNLHTVIASARSAVYNHPNKKVRARLKRRGLSILQTEHWGNFVYMGL